MHRGAPIIAQHHLDGDTAELDNTVIDVLKRSVRLANIHEARDRLNMVWKDLSRTAPRLILGDKRLKFHIAINRRSATVTLKMPEHCGCATDKDERRQLRIVIVKAAGTRRPKEKRVVKKSGNDGRNIRCELARLKTCYQDDQQE
jgi:hypothetical protein